MKKERNIVYYIVLFVLFLSSCDIKNNEKNNTDCYVSNGIGYEYVDCNDSLNINKYHGKKVKPITPEIAIIIEKTGKIPIIRVIPNLDTRFFTNDGDPLIWYYKRKDGKLELFSLPGKHPQYNENLSVITSELAEKIIGALEHNKLDVFVTNALLPEEECYA